jgi:hypothetical protein
VPSFVGIRRYLVAIAAGLVFSMAVALAGRVLGLQDLAIAVDPLVTMFAAGLGIALMLGINLGMHMAVKALDGQEAGPARPSAGICLVLFAGAVLAGGILSARIAG